MVWGETNTKPGESTMSTVHLKMTDPTVAAIVKAAFPHFTGKDVRAVIADTVTFHGTMWDKGSKRDYVMMDINSRRLSHIPTERYNVPSEAHRTPHAIPAGFVCVVRDRWGQLEHVEIIGPAANITPMLEAPAELTHDERIVLVATRSCKSSYGLIKDYRFVEAQSRTGITRERYEAAKVSLIGRKLLNRAGAITVEGKNAIGWADFPTRESEPAVLEA
jgi:hypothetical protein